MPKSDQLGRLDAAIKDAGVPIHGLSMQQEDPPQVRIDFKPEATAFQRTQAQTVVTTFDWRDRRPRPYADIISQIDGLSSTQRTRLFALIAAHILRQNPRLAALVGIAIEGDEPVP